MMKKFKIFGWVCCSFLLWSCGHSQGTLSDAVLPSSPVVNTDSDTGTDSETTLPAPSESKPTPVPTPVVAKEFDTLAQRLNVDASYVSPLSSDWKKTFSTQLSLTNTEIQDLYAAGTFDSVFHLATEDQLDWFDSLSKVYVDPWFLTGCKFCTVIKRNFLGSRKYFLTGEASAPSEVNGLGAHPATAFDPVNKNYLIIWDEATADGGSSIYAKLVSEDGVTIRVDRKQISTPRPTQGCLFANFAQQTGLTAPTDCKKNVDPSVAYNDGHFLVTWTEQINAVKPVGQTMSVILGKMIVSNTLAPLNSNWDEGILLSKIRYASTDPNHAARNDNEVQAWSQNEYSALTPFFGTGAGQGAFILVWDTTRDYISCVDPDRRTSTSIYGRMIPVNFSPTTGNKDIFMISTDPSTSQPQCAPNSDVTSARKSRVASLKTTGQFLTVFEISKNVPASSPSIMTYLMTASSDLNVTAGAPKGFGAMNEGLYDPDVAATSDKFLVVGSAENAALELTEVIPEADGINLRLGNSKTYTGPDGVNTSRPRMVVNRVTGAEGGAHDFPLEYVVAYEARPSDGGSNVSEIQVASFNEVLASIDPKAVLAAPGFSTNISPALASAEKKVLVVWNAVKSGEGHIFDSVVTVNQPLNRAPTAVIEVVGHPEDPAVVASSEAVVLSGESSSDPDGDVLTYQWRFVSGPAVTLSGTTSSKITFTAPRVDSVQDIVIELIVKDARQATSRAVQKTIKVQPPVNQKPTAAIGVIGHPIDPVEVASGENVQLSGDGSRDPEDGTNLTYAWSQVGGPSVTLNNPASSHATFTAPVIPEGNPEQNITIQLVIKDTRNLASDPVQKTIKVKAQPHINQKPVALIDVVGHPADPVEVAAGENVELSGDRSTDPEGSAVTYAWSQVPGGPAINFNGTASLSHAVFTAPTLPAGDPPQNVTVQLIVTDGSGLASDPVRKTITVKAPPPVNHPPVAVIDVIGHENENPPMVTMGTTVALSGVNSSDPDGQIDSPFVYHWRQTTGSTPPIALINGGTATPYFTAPTVSTPANISIDLWVTDVRGLDSPVVSKIIRVNPLPNNPPRAKITLSGETAPITTLTVDDSSADVVMDASGNPSWPRTRVTLSGAASDNGEAPPQPVQGYTWVQVGATTQTAIEATSNPTPAEFSFIVPDITSVQGSATITIRLTVNDGGWSTNTASQDIVITVNAVNHRPTAPVLSGPANGLITPPSRVALTWQASQDPDVAVEGDQLVYDVYFGAQNPPTSTFANCMGITQPRCIIDSLAPSTNYYWQVRARDRANETLPSLSSGINNLGTDNSVLARWSFDDGPNGLCAGDDPSLRGIRVCDQSGNGRHMRIGTFSTVVTPQWLEEGDLFLGEQVQGILRRALGVDAYLDTTPWTVSNTSQSSIEFWVYPAQLVAGRVHSLFFSRHYISLLNIKRLIVQYDGSSGLVYFTTNVSADPNGGLLLTSSQPVQIHQWNHVVCLFGPSGRKIYINGILSSSDNQVVSLGEGTGDILLGWDQSSGYLSGVLDEVVLYNQAFSSDVILDLSTAH